jgi:flagellar hook assembly protein FlgD
VVNAVDDLGRQSSSERAFFLNNTLGYLQVNPARVVVRRRGGSLRVGFRLTRPARVTLTIETVSGATVRTIQRRLGPGRTSIRWNGRYSSGVRAFAGPYVARVRASNAFGPAELERRFVVRRTR